MNARKTSYCKSLIRLLINSDTEEKRHGKGFKLGWIYFSVAGRTIDRKIAST